MKKLERKKFFKFEYIQSLSTKFLIIRIEIIKIEIN